MDTFGVLSVPTRLSVRDCLELWLHSSPRHAKMWTRRWCFWNGVSALLRLPPLCLRREKIQPSYLLYSKWLWPGQWNPCLCQLCPRPISRGSSPPVWTAASVWFPSFVSIWKIALHPVLWAVQQSERGAQTACNWLGSISNFCVTLSCSHSGPRQLERLAVVFCCSWRGKGDVIENLLLKRDFSKSKRTSSMFSKLMDVLQELWVMAETYFAVKSSGSQLGVLVE